MGADISVVNEKIWNKSDDTGTETKTENHQDMEKSEGKGTGHQWAVCLGIKDR